MCGSASKQNNPVVFLKIIMTHKQNLEKSYALPHNLVIHFLKSFFTNSNFSRYISLSKKDVSVEILWTFVIIAVQLWLSVIIWCVKIMQNGNHDNWPSKIGHKWKSSALINLARFIFLCLHTNQKVYEICFIIAFKQ